MIELTEKQLAAIAGPGSRPTRVVNPQTMETFVLLPIDQFERLTGEEYDDTPWTRDELQALAWQRVQHEDCSDYDHLPETPTSETP